MVRRVQGAPPAATLVAIALSLLVLAGEVTVVETLRFRAIILGLGLALAFLTLKPKAERARSVSYGLALASLGISLAIAASGRGFLARASEPTSLDLGLGLSLLGLVITGAWISTGAALPVLSLATMAYVLWGGELDRVGLSMIAHRGYDIARLVGSMVMGFEGIFGVPLDVAATTIGLFAIYGAVLEASGAAQFFLDLSFATFSGGNSARGAGRAVTLAGFLLGSVSGSGVATTLTLGGASAPLLKRAGFSRENAGALLAAAGIGAILSPPTLGAAAFLIAEFLKISYGQVLLMAVVPTLLYYFGIVLMIEADVPRETVVSAATSDAPMQATPLAAILKTGGHHLVSPLLIVAFLMMGYSATRSAFLAACAAVVLSFINRAQALTPARLRRAMISAGATLVPVITTTACAGILVAGLTLTGLGLKVATLIVSLAGSNATGVILLSAVSVSVLGLSVPVTASYILSAVTIAPALIHVGVNELAAHMFIFYYAVLSEVSPPTALSPMAAATICHGYPYRTVMATLRYTLPAFLVPLIFTMHQDGLGLLLQAPWSEVTLSTTLAVLIVMAASAAASGYFRRSLSMPWRVVYGVAAALLLFLVGPWRWLGVVVFVLAIVGSRPNRSPRPSS